ncbi:MAG: hypothetical protein IIC85_15605 [Chloroflexi bacterium]|nr:hypothetical protein [Chloroflexota bacterium]
MLDTARYIKSDPFLQFVYMFAATVAIQSLHMVEHVAQVYQKFVLHSASAHGLIGQLDLEPVHFAFNLFYLGTLIYVMLGWYSYGSRMCNHQKMWGVVITATVILQSYHMVEHSVKLAQFIATNVQGTPGLFGGHFDGVIFHAVLNTAVFVPVVVVFLCAGVYKHFVAKPPVDLPIA